MLLEPSKKFLARIRDGSQKKLKVIAWKQHSIHLFNQLPNFSLTPRCPSLSLHAERVSWMYQSENKHENHEKQIINGGKNTVFQFKKLSKSRRLIHLWQNMIISFWMNFLLICSRVMKHIKITKFNEKSLLKWRRVIQLLPYILKPLKVATLKYWEKAQKYDTFRVGHRGVKMNISYGIFDF